MRFLLNCCTKYIKRNYEFHFVLVECCCKLNVFCIIFYVFKYIKVDFLHALIIFFCMLFKERKKIRKERMNNKIKGVNCNVCSCRVWFCVCMWNLIAFRNFHNVQEQKNHIMVWKRGEKKSQHKHRIQKMKRNEREICCVNV